MQNYIVVDFKKICNTAKEALDVVGVGDMDIAFPIENVWTWEDAHQVIRKLTIK